MRRFRVSLASVMALAVLSACSTQKATWTNIAYHNTTTHYNIWWNGNESLKEGVRNLERQTKDDYTRILPVYKLGTKEEAFSIKPQMDRAIEKGIKGIKKHSIFVDGQEHVPYISKSYLLSAYASFYLQDYLTCSNTCQMLTAQYAGTEVADEAAILQARCSTQEQRYQDAESALDQLVTAEGKGDFAKGQRLSLYMAMAECTLPQEKYKKAVEFLKRALDQRPSRVERARLNYILGQVYQSQEKRPTAAKYYEKVLKLSPSYEMEFNARINIASCADLQHTDVAKLEKLLDKMLADRKNAEFVDQIYYAKGEMYMGLKNPKKACENFRLSAAKATANPAQKARTCIRLAGVLYDKYQDYDQAQRYLDTAMHIIKSDYPDYESVRSRYEILTQLTSYTRVYERNDSLLAVAAMPSAKRTDLINKKIEDLKKREEEARQRELLEQLSGDAKAQANALQGDWYFYNNNTVQKGKDSFRQRWGLRANEDYWFLSKKGLLGMNMGVAENSAEESEADDPEKEQQAAEGESKEGKKGKKKADKNGDPNDPHSVAYYLKDLPSTQEQKDSMMTLTAISLLNAGYIFYDGVHDIPRALECYVRMATDYTAHEEIVQAFYMLYKIYDRQGNTPQANYYRDMVLMGFPDSDFANLIRDEDYYKEVLKRERMIREDYEQVYTQYRKRRYEQTIALVHTAKEDYESDPMLPKFSYWEALAEARLGHKDNAVSILKDIVSAGAATDTIVVLAQAQLAFLVGDSALATMLTDGSANQEAEGSSSDVSPKTVLSPNKKPSAVAPSDTLSKEAQLFRYREQMQHYVIILVNEKHVRITDLQTQMAAFNLEYYSNAGYKSSPLMFTDSIQMLTIARFKDANEALSYSRHLNMDASPLKKYNAGDYEVFAISTQNYTTFYKRKKIDAYREFYNKNYQK